MPTPTKLFSAAHTHETMALTGELIRASDKGPVELLIPHDVECTKGFWILTAWLKDGLTAPPTLGRQVTVDGIPRISREAQVQLRQASIKGSRSLGPYTKWREAQCARLGLRPDRTAPEAKVDEIVKSVRAAPRGDVIWVGTDTTEAFGDATGRDGRIQKSLQVLGSRLHGPGAVDDICGKLYNSIPADARLVVISRGGGDAASLALFSDARVLEAVQFVQRTHRVPVLCAVGHRSDHPLLEQVATWSVGTPSGLTSILKLLVTGQPTYTQSREKQSAESRGMSNKYDRLTHSHSELTTRLRQVVSERERLQGHTNDLQSKLTQCKTDLNRARKQKFSADQRHARDLEESRRDSAVKTTGAKYRAQAPWAVGTGLVSAVGLVVSGHHQTALAIFVLGIVLGLVLWFLPRWRSTERLSN